MSHHRYHSSTSSASTSSSSSGYREDKSRRNGVLFSNPPPRPPIVSPACPDGVFEHHRHPRDQRDLPPIPTKLTRQLPPRSDSRIYGFSDASQANPNVPLKASMAALRLDPSRRPPYSSSSGSNRSSSDSNSSSGSASSPSTPATSPTSSDFGDDDCVNARSTRGSSSSSGSHGRSSRKAVPPPLPLSNHSSRSIGSRDVPKPSPPVFSQFVPTDDRHSGDSRRSDRHADHRDHHHHSHHHYDQDHHDSRSSKRMTGLDHVVVARGNMGIERDVKDVIGQLRNMRAV